MANGTDDHYDYDRDRGIFTPRDRRFLAGEIDDELSVKAKRQKRFRLRKRVFDAIQDLAYLEELETRDLFNIAEEVSSGMTAGANPAVFDVDQERYREIVRTRQAMKAVVFMFREMFPLGIVVPLIERQFEIAAALDHFDETGRYGLYDATLDIELEKEMPLFEAINEVTFRGTKETFDRDEYPGLFEVLDYSAPTAELLHLTEYAETVYEVIKERTVSLDDHSPDRNDIIENVAGQTVLSEGEVDHTIEIMILAGFCQSDGDGNLTLTDDSDTSGKK